MTYSGDLVSFNTLTRIIAQLRSPDGCPWDREQTHQSIKNYLLEECYETLQALDEGDPQKLKEELGDVLLQIMLHSQIASETDEFTVNDVLEGLAEKLLYRHPHVFGDTKAETARDVEANWEISKREEEGHTSVLDGVSPQMPALAYSQSIHRRAANAGFDWKNMNGVLEKLREEVSELQDAETKERQEEEMGDILATLVNVGRKMDIDMETALRKANRRFYRRFTAMEELCEQRGLDLRKMTPDQHEDLWREAKEMIDTENRNNG